MGWLANGYVMRAFRAVLEQGGTGRPDRCCGLVPRNALFKGSEQVLSRAVLAASLVTIELSNFKYRLLFARGGADEDGLTVYRQSLHNS